MTNNIERFESLLGSVQRDGMPKLMEYIRKKTDFYTAPASTKYHSACEGGLLQHSLNVYDCLIAKKENPMWKPVLQDISEDSLIIMALLHDFCKTNFYVEGTKNQKTYDPAKVEAADSWQIKHDSAGDFIWETVKTYQIEDQMPLGHGEKSVMLLQCYIRLTLQEVFAIRWHMGFTDEGINQLTLGNVMEKYPVVLALFEADLEAAKLLEKEQ